MCTACSVTKKKSVEFTHLILRLTSTRLSEIVSDHLEEMVKLEEIVVLCEHCSCKVGKKSTSIAKLPEILTLQLSRNYFGAYDDRHVEFEEILNMTTNSSEGVVAYELTSVIYHKGGKVNKGHYTVDVKDMTNNENNIWWSCNDRTVAKLKTKPVSTGKECIFVYVKKTYNSNTVPRTEYDSFLLALVINSNEEYESAMEQKKFADVNNKRTSQRLETRTSIRSNFFTTDAIPEICLFFPFTEQYAASILSNRSLAPNIQDLSDLMHVLQAEGIEADFFLDKFCMYSSDNIDDVKADYLHLTRNKGICDFALEACRSELIKDACVVVLESELIKDACVVVLESELVESKLGII